MKAIIILLIAFSPLFLKAQTETFDIITYQPPAGWKKSATEYMTSYQTVDNVSGTWCQVGIYKSVASSGNATNDFSSEWKALVKPETFAGAKEPSPTSSTKDGWTYNIGGSTFKWQNKDSYVLLMNVSGYGTMATIHVSGNSNKYDNEVQNLFGSIQLEKPAQATQQQVQQNQSQPTTTPVTNVTPSSTTSIIKVTDAPGVHGIKSSTTNFDDGWVAQPFADYVKVVKQQVTVLLHYAISIDDEMRAASNMAVVMWNRMVASRYRTSNLMEYKNPPYTYFNVWFVETDAVEVATNKNVHVGLRVLVANGIASCVEMVAPTAAVFQQEFPDYEKMASMVNYNKFSVSAADVVGTWEESSSTAVNLYNTVTGGYAGMNAVAMASSFTLRGDGTYDSEHKGASGMVGSMTTYDQKYHGNYTLTPWDVTMTNRFKGKTDVYFCQYEAVRGGRILHLRDKVATSMTYRLVKTK